MFGFKETDSPQIFILIRSLPGRAIAHLNRIGITLARPHVVQMTSAYVRLLKLRLGRPRRALRFLLMTQRWTDVDVRFWLYYGTAAFRRTNHVESGTADLADPRLKLKTV